MITLIQGDLLETEADVIAHGCNTVGGYGSGVAGQIAKKYPKARHYYLDKYEEDGWELGEVQVVPQWDGKYIANCATQQEYLPRGVLHADYKAIEECLYKVKQFAETHCYTVALPKIGCGLAGGEWSVVEKIINKVFDDVEVLVYYL